MAADVAREAGELYRVRQGLDKRNELSIGDQALIHGTRAYLRPAHLASASSGLRLLLAPVVE